MKSIEIDDDLYAFIASQTKHIGENASQILRRLLMSQTSQPCEVTTGTTESGPPVKRTANASSKPVSKARSAAGKEAVASAAVVSQEVKSTPQTPNATVAKAEAPIATSASDSADKENHILTVVSQDAVNTFTKRVDQFLFVLSQAYRLNTSNFESVEDIKGKNRTYFAKSKEALLLNGSSTNPKEIPHSPYWVVTNNNTAKKVSMLQNVLRTLGYEANVIETIVSRFAP